ncbi:MAG TPA: hypothetical protein VFK57_14410 [Vicinamibacterales bacterium]|nr:hypothetical protein [Vicinamibacterales bacterium]
MTMLCVATTALMLLQPAAARPAPPKPAAAKPAAAKPAATDLAVTLSYKGKGTVDAGHQLIAWLFTDANVTSSSRPIATLTTAKNGDTLTFKDVPATPVYIFAAYDARGGYDGRNGPPPAGIPTALYRKVAKGPATAVKAGGPAVKLRFDDSQPWKP